MLKNRYLFWKNVVNLVLMLIGTLVIITLLTGMQNETSRRRQLSRSEQLLNEVTAVIQSNREDAADLTAIYHESNQAVLEDLQYIFSAGLFDELLSSDTGREERSQVFGDIMELANVDRLFLVTGQGRVRISADTGLLGKKLGSDDIMDPDALETLLSGSTLQDGTVTPVRATLEGTEYYFYSTPLVRGALTYYLLLGQRCDTLESQVNSMLDVTSAIRQSSISDSSSIFALDGEGKFSYFEFNGEVLTGRTAEECGITSAMLKDDWSGVASVNGVPCCCLIRTVADGSYLGVVSPTVTTAYLGVTAPTSGVYAGNSRAVFWSVLMYLMVSSLMLMYGIIIRTDRHRRGEVLDLRVIHRGKGDNALLFNRTVAAKVLPVTAMGLAAVFVMCFFVQSLLSLSSSLTESEAVLDSLQSRMASLQSSESVLKDYYEDRYLAKARVLAYVLEEDVSALTQGTRHTYTEYDGKGNRQALTDSEGNPLTSTAYSAPLMDLVKSNALEDIFIFDESGHVIACSGDIWYFTLSHDPEDQSYPFRAVLEEKQEYLVQSLQTNEVDESGALHQYIGVPFTYYTYSLNGETVYASRYEYSDWLAGNTDYAVTPHTGLLQIAAENSVMQRILSTTGITQAFRNVRVDTSGFVIAMAEEGDHAVVCSGESRLEGRTAAELGFSDSAFSGSYNGFVTLNGESHFICSRLYQGYYLVTAIPTDDIFQNRMAFSLVTVLINFIFMVIMSSMITLSTRQEELVYHQLAQLEKEDPNASPFTILMPNGRRKSSSSAASRWDGRRTRWSKLGPEQKLFTLIGYCGYTVVFYMLLLLIGIKSFGVGSDVIRYVMNGGWDRGLNIFAFSHCVLTAAFVVAAVHIINRFVRMVTDVLGTRTETVGQLLRSVTKYGGAIGCIFYFLYTMGLDTTSLLASASILSLVIGLGANSLIGDILAGIFIVFEGEFRVGDIVTVNDFRGQVLEIGLRTTKLMDATDNIKIFNNSSISGVLNMTKEASYAVCDVSIAYGENLEKVEAVLKEELPGFRQRLPQLLEDVKYVGVVELGDSAVILRLLGRCEEKDRIILGRALNREVFLLFQKHNIDIPFPQLTVSHL